MVQPAYLYLIIKTSLSIDELKTKKMDITTELKANLKEDKINLYQAISSLKQSMLEYKDERKSEWKSFKNKFNDDLDKVQKSLNNLTPPHKKKKK